MKDRYALPDGSVAIWDDEKPEAAGIRVENGHWFGSGTIGRPMSLGWNDYRTFTGNPRSIARLLSNMRIPIRVDGFLIDVQKTIDYFSKCA
jgi:hypothetical protein